MTHLFDWMKQRTLLLTCLAVSFLLHFAAVGYFYTHPVLIYPSWKSLFGLSAAAPDLLELEEEDLELVKKNELIEEAFQQILVLSPHFQQPLDHLELPQGLALSPNEETLSHSVVDIESEMHWENAEADPFIAVQESPLFHEDSIINSLFIPKESSWNFATQIQIENEPALAELSPFAFSEEWLSPEAPLEQDSIHVSSVSIEASQEMDIPGVKMLDSFPTEGTGSDLPLTLSTDPSAMSSGVSEIHAPAEPAETSHSYFLSQTTPEMSSTPSVRAPVSALPDLDAYQFPRIAVATSWNDDFHIDLKFLPQEEDKGYIFSIALTPNFDLGQYSLKQNIYFLIDRSNSVQKHRFGVFKRAVLKALASMQKGDAFNIYIIDRKVTKFTSAPLQITPKAIQAAEDFLDKQEAGSMFAGSDIYSSLEKVLPDIPLTEEMHTAILLTDGNTIHNSPKQQHVLSKWLEKNNGKLSLYTAAVGQKNNLLMLDLISSISGGKLLYSDTHASFPRKLAKLVLDLKNPVAKDLTITAVAQYPDAQITFYPASHHLPALYSNQPYMIYGYIDEPCNFDLTIQGQHGQEWIAIKKTVCFIEGEKGSRHLAKQWKAQQANLCYTRFLREGKSSYLKDAREILKANRTEIAFE